MLCNVFCQNGRQGIFFLDSNEEKTKITVKLYYNMKFVYMQYRIGRGWRWCRIVCCTCPQTRLRRTGVACRAIKRPSSAENCDVAQDDWWAPRIPQHPVDRDTGLQSCLESKECSLEGTRLPPECVWLLPHRAPAKVVTITHSEIDAKPPKPYIGWS